MKRRGAVIRKAILAAAIFAGGCATYQPAPLEPARVQVDFAARSLSDDAAKTFATRDDKGEVIWTFDSLMKVALLYHPDMEVARAHAAAVQSGEKTAGQSPNPTVGFSPQLATNAGSVNPWTVGLTFDLPIETAGKREIRIGQAMALSNAARIELAEAAWKVRSRLRDALLDLDFAVTENQLLKREAAEREKYAGLLEARLKAGEASRQDLDAARLDLLAARSAWHASQGRVSEAEVKLAAALGMTRKGLGASPYEALKLALQQDISPENAKELQREALLNRLDVHKALAEYAAAEKALELEVAKQYPDLHIGPGYQFDQGQHKWELGLSLELPILTQNGGPIAEAAAHRMELAAKFSAIQAGAIEELESAQAKFESAIEEYLDAIGQTATASKQVTAADKSLAAGEGDRLSLLSAQVQRDVAERLSLEARRRRTAAQAALEDAIQKPLAIEPTPAPSTATSPATKSTETP